MVLLLSKCLHWETLGEVTQQSRSDLAGRLASRNHSRQRTAMRAAPDIDGRFSIGILAILKVQSSLGLWVNIA